MNFTILGSLGNVSKPLAEILISKGHRVTIVSSNQQKRNEIESLGAKVAIGSVTDVDFLNAAFKDADAVYTMVPPNWEVTDYRGYIAKTGEVYRAAIQKSGIKRVVNLSSVGAHLSQGTGPIAGLYDVEHAFKNLDGVSVKHLRARIFYINYFFDIGTIRNMGLMGNNYGSHTPLLLVHPRDIAMAAVQELEEIFEGKSSRYVVSERITVSEAVKILGSSIGMPQLPWVQFRDEEAYVGMTASGMSPAIAKVYVEMGNAIQSGILFEDFQANNPPFWGKTTLIDFATEFAAVYKSQV